MYVCVSVRVHVCVSVCVCVYLCEPQSESQLLRILRQFALNLLVIAVVS